MSAKKRFTIAPDLASGLRNSIQSAAANVGQLHYDMMSIEMIERDPKNPRKLSLSLDEILNGFIKSDIQFSVKSKEYEALLELAESIKKIGIKNAVEVYKDGQKYRIITGERRYLAAILAQQKTIPVRIVEKPDEFNLRYTQWVENMNRQDLSLFEKLNNLLLISEAYQKTHQKEFTEQALQQVLGISSIQAYRYFSLLKADIEIIRLIEKGQLNNLKLVQQLVAMKDKQAYNQMIAWIDAEKEEVTSLARYQLAIAQKKKLGKYTSTSNEVIYLGVLSDAKMAKHLMQIILADNRLIPYQHLLEKVDWTSSRAITKAFKDLFSVIEQILCTSEIA